MDGNTIETTFCFKYLSKFVDLKLSTIESLVANDYQSIYSLIAFDLDIDLNQLPNISMGQKSILREALLKLKKELNLWIDSERKSDSKVSSNLSSALSSTPILKSKEYPFVKSDHLFKEFVTNALLEMTSETQSGPSLQPNVTSFGDSGINATDSYVSKLSPIRENGRNSAKKRDNESLDLPENTENSSLNISSDKTVDKSQPKEKKRKKKKFLYSVKNHRKSQKTQTERKVFINIDNNSQTEETEEESQTTEVIEDSKSSIDLKPNEKKFTISSFDDISIWKAKKPEILRLIKIESKQIELKRDEKAMKEISRFFKTIEINGMKSPFVVCDLCFDSNDVRLLIGSNNTLRLHLLSKRHQKDSEHLKNLGFVSEESKKIFDLKTKGNKSPEKSYDDLVKLMSEPQIVVSKLNISFNELKNKYLAEVLDKNSQKSQFVVNNYDDVFTKDKTEKTNACLKSYKCDFEGCSSAFVYPFSLEQHKARHNMKTGSKRESNSGAQKKRQTISVLHGMNGLVSNYMKKNPSQVLNTSAPLDTNSTESKFSSDCLLSKPNITSNDENLNDKIVSKIKDWFRTKTQLNDFI